MKCEKCGTKLNKSANFCRVCGTHINNDSLDKNTSEKIKDEKKDDLIVEDLSVLSSSDELKKILNEISADEVDNEPTVSIPSDLINKYCKKGDIIEEKNDLEESQNESDLLKQESSDTEIENQKEVQDNNDAVDEDEKENIQDNDCDEVKPRVEKFQELNSDFTDSKILNTENSEKLFNIKDDVELCDENKNVELFEKENIKVHYGRKFFVFFALLICILTIIYLIYVLYGSRNELEKIDKEKVTLQSEIANLKDISSFKDKSSGLFNFNGYVLYLNNDNYFVLDNRLFININENTYVIQINKDISFNDIKDKKNDYIKQFKNDGYNVSSYGNKRIDSLDYFVFNVVDSKSNKKIIAYTKLDENSVIGIIISNKKNIVDYSLLESINSIISSVSKSEIQSEANLNIFIEKK